MEKANLLPSGWKVYYDEQRSRVYYVNLFTKDTQWTRPLPPETHNIIDIKRILVANNLPILFFFFVSLFFIYTWNDQAYKPADYTGSDQSNIHAKETYDRGMSKKITIVLLDGGRLSKSIFVTDFLLKYGSGEVYFLVKDYPKHENGNKNECHKKNTELDESPCLVVGRQNTATEFVANKCQYAHCKTMVDGDEKCRYQEQDAREYYSEHFQNKGYLPLGMRLDAWSSLEELLNNQSQSIFILSNRRYAFNAIFSESTSKSRGHLAKILRNRTDSMNAFVKIATKWTGNVNSPHSDQLGTDQYMKVLLNSIFTLAPAGHNPECFRLYEAVESGSIPIVVQTEHHACKDSLYYWRDSPIIFLQKWDDLFPTIENLLEDMAALNQRQADLQQWYKNKMSIIVSEFENFMLNKSTST